MLVNKTASLVGQIARLRVRAMAVSTHIQTLTNKNQPTRNTSR